MYYEIRYTMLEIMIVHNVEYVQGTVNHDDDTWCLVQEPSQQNELPNTRIFIGHISIKSLTAEITTEHDGIVPNK